MTDAMGDAGRIDLVVSADGDRMRAVSVRAARPQIVASLVGLSATDAAARVGLLFPLCGMAHRAALAAALDALGQSVGRPVTTADLLIEQAEAWAWRFAIDLPSALGEAPALSDLARVRKAAAEVRAGRAEAEVLAPLMDALIDRDHLADRLLNFAADLDSRGFGDCRPPPLGDKTPGWYSGRLASRPGFARTPESESGPAEVGVGAGEPLAARLQSQIAAARAAPVRVMEAFTSLAPSLVSVSRHDDRSASALTETTRGPLAYWVRLDEAGRIGAIASVAPTEWNFHPEGPCVARLTGRPGPHDPLRVARFIAAVLDPCVPVAARLALAEAPQTEPLEMSHA